MAAFTGDRPRKSTGRPGEFEYDCSFCHSKLGTAGVLRQHYARTHYQDEQIRVQLGRHLDYVCAVEGCDKHCRSPITLKRHYTEKGPHEVEEMLDAGLAVWHLRKNTFAMVEDTVAWLVQSGYVRHEDPSKRPVE